MKRLFFIAGEPSGDMHAARLIAAIRDRRPGWHVSGYGGERMRDAGMELRFDLASMAVMGIVEVARHLGTIRHLFNDLRDTLDRERPDALVLVDYPGFNLRAAAMARDRNIPVIYYISPQVWAWKKRRIHTIARIVDRMLVILPFERELYQKVGVPCDYVGHPLLDDPFLADPPSMEGRPPVLAVLPGSREQEIRRIGPAMMETARRYLERHPETRLVSAAVDDARARQIRDMAPDLPLEVMVNGMREVLAQARGALVASGTATLQTALAGVPMLVVYRMHPVTFLLAACVVRVPHISLVNLLAGREIVPEILQDRARPDVLLPALESIMATGDRRDRMARDLRELRERLGGPGASERAAEILIRTVEAYPVETARAGTTA
ncbi:MAG TPA: lipid-A-disaccharide synthase [Candidatus Hydrogenedentes bacterium]|nr:lipid-A-disaccharide synthase [Candidatus Hydrogenedentota bacterium]